MTVTIEAPVTSAGSYVQTLLDPADEEFEFCTAHGLVLCAGNNLGWLVREAGTGLHDGQLLATVETSEDQFELIQLAGGFRWSRHESFRGALKSLVVRLSAP